MHVSFSESNQTLHDGLLVLELQPAYQLLERMVHGSNTVGASDGASVGEAVGTSVGDTEGDDESSAFITHVPASFDHSQSLYLLFSLATQRHAFSLDSNTT